MNRMPPGFQPSAVTPGLDMKKAQLAARFVKLVQGFQKMGMQGFAFVLDSANELDVVDMNAALDILETQFSKAHK